MRRSGTALILTLAGVGLLAVLALRLEGRIWWCACGSPALWTSDAISSHNSQHLFDPYTFTHVLHGIAFFGILAWLWKSGGIGAKLTIALVVEAAWEVLENSPMIIDRYRSETISLNYTGDSIANSVGDILACGIGVLLARKLGLRWSIALWVTIEIVLLVWIRDNLFLSTLMLICPIDAIKAWQGGG